MPGDTPTGLVPTGLVPTGLVPTGLARGSTPAPGGSNSELPPPMRMLRTLRLFGLIPLVIVWFGIDEGAKLFLVALGVFFPSTSTPCTAYARSIRS
jgi:sulfonate transport system permease protein